MADKEYLKNFERQIELDKKNIEESSLTPRNKELIMQFHREYKIIKNLSYPSIHKHLINLRMLGTYLDKDFDAVIENKQVFLEVFDRLKSRKIGNGDRHYSDSSIYDFKKVLKVFYKWLYGRGKEYPPCVSWINLSKAPYKNKLPETILMKEDILKLVSAATNSRDKAMIYSLWESGIRVGEFLTLRVRNLDFDENGCFFILNASKTDLRKQRMIECTSYLSTWLNTHPGRENPNSHLWVNIIDRNRGKKIDYTSFYKILALLGSKAAIKKKVNPHSFRHSRATYLAKYLTEQELKIYFGWTGDSSMVKRYILLAEGI